MSYLVLCVFDLKDAGREDYLYACMDLAAFGLRQIVKSENGPSFKLPGTAVMGMFEGKNVDDVRSVVAKKVQGVFNARGLSVDFFIIASSDWACAGEST
jgi:hypothetical protein